VLSIFNPERLPTPETKLQHGSQSNAFRRQVLTLVFAIVLIWISSVVSAQSPQPIDCLYYSSDHPPAAEVVEQALATLRTIQFDGETLSSAELPARLTAAARPKYVQMVAGLANFDADADPDGWRVDLVLRDQQDRPVVARASARFELRPRASIIGTDRFITHDVSTIRWSTNLDFDEQGVASVKLPLRRSLEPALGWSPSFPAVNPANSRRSSSRDRGVTGIFDQPAFTDLRDLAATPAVGELRVRVSVASEGIFEAAVPVRVRPPGLVDTRWPYR
jgi:hypothetical protein